tara:strand:+ start:795 stop:1001 length:207 start_codon:yes stop_codon:yes gene_type:complete
MRRYKNKSRKTGLHSDIALLVQRNEDLHNKCRLENERLRLKVNRLLRKLNILKKKMNEQSKECQTTVS